MKWFVHVLQNYANFNGRARRKEFWMFFLFNLIFGIAAIIADNIIGFTFGDSGYGILYLIYNLVVVLPTIAVTVRRLHDTGKSGWFYFIALIPIIGSIWLLVVLCSDSDYPNEYGPNPKEAEVNFEMQ